MPNPTHNWYLGLDLGQRRDHSALATISRVGNILILRDIARFPLGTSYTIYPDVVARRVAQIQAFEADAARHSEHSPTTPKLRPTRNDAAENRPAQPAVTGPASHTEHSPTTPKLRLTRNDAAENRPAQPAVTEPARRSQTRASKYATLYPAIAAPIRPVEIRPTIALAIDAAGPGAPIADELRRANLPLDLYPCRITAGKVAARTANGEILVPRRTLIANLVNLIEAQRLRIPRDLPLWRALRAELLDLRAPDGKPGNPFGHDDMVIAVALAAWLAEIDYGRNASHFLRKSDPTARSHDP